MLYSKIVASWACTYLAVSSVSLWMKNWAKENVPVLRSLRNIHYANVTENILIISYGALSLFFK